jgi:hypothetical protein
MAVKRDVWVKKRDVWVKKRSATNLESIMLYQHMPDYRPLRRYDHCNYYMAVN